MFFRSNNFCCLLPEPRKRKIENSDSDDDDDFYDRTGAVERKRQLKAANSQTNALSYTELLEQEQELIDNISKINLQIDEYQNRDRLAKTSSSSASSTANTEDELDDFMSNLSKDKQLDKIEIRRMRVQLQTLRNDHLRLQKLINIARPIDLPPLKSDDKLSEKPKKLNLPLFGKRGTFKFGNSAAAASAGVAKKIVPVETKTVTSATLTSPTVVSNDKSYKSDEEEMEDHEEKPKTEIKNNKFIKTTIHSNSNTINTAEETNEETEDNTMKDAAAKKRRNRIRIRGDRYRENVDIDDSIEHKDVAKYSTWVPPENQCGDGSTNLNQKYGY